MSLAPWRSPLSRALHRNHSQPEARFLQLATIQLNGQPANRTVVFRGFLDDTDQLKFVTDTRSEKTEQIEQNPKAEACWYFIKTREQFRIAGTLTLIRATDPDSALQQARKTAWQELSDAARLQFAWPTPGEPRADAAAFAPQPPDATEPLPYFCLLLLEPERVDHLELRGEPQNRCLYQRNQNQVWSAQAINP
ncbi:Npun_F5749 family FMN-dependent PPOX-type flavoprotein [Trichocoleus sp. FACHB-262]|uniref:Npun_F5749 family FMN-dependent PPOX-type flavoprotein n=1 Tax=Trichocoleus sp. FACHB-262 TaxID=2692869 RepID=UPI00168314ED|nr:Npun_F5749 family FMN-dependent PPOX-type flavoprotein [Trichocoleus sp. FACHB-262]MBD2123889.1 pyridoxamine 5'-phosphate oxidase family protein [Trichocoleus sp. FACHB-262]